MKIKINAVQIRAMSGKTTFTKTSHWYQKEL